ncbi:hypothetical protein RclHR1_07910007 [Rhizophagus clarus]|uniref:Uncharacterized protein n=1 Tax=Rhizophagus clarus TaxID=94130 RepID=A0A2Z6RYD2_9GLOM|nr:hypothetical protein RclHR1_07910007 [Rhizophagus clarus]
MFGLVNGFCDQKSEQSEPNIHCVITTYIIVTFRSNLVVYENGQEAPLPRQSPSPLQRQGVAIELYDVQASNFYCNVNHKSYILASNANDQQQNIF